MVGPDNVLTLSGAPGVAAAVVRGDEVTATWATGVADVVRGGTLSVDTAFNWFSMTKIVTATAAMMLSEAGSLDLEASVSRYLGDMWPQRLRAARVRHLLNHTSGLGNPIPIRWVHAEGKPRPDPAAFLARVLSRQRLRSYRSERAARYSNIGFLALGQVIAEASGTDYESAVRELILDPLQMEHTAFRWGDANLLSLPRATGHVRLHPLAAPLLSAVLPANLMGPRSDRTLTLRSFEVDGASYGGLIGTVGDAARLLAVFTNRGTVDSRRVLSSAAVDTMTTIATAGRPYDFGLGWYRPHDDRSTSVQHLGGGIGYFNVLRANISGERGAVVMSNITKHWDIAAFADTLLAEPVDP